MRCPLILTNIQARPTVRHDSRRHAILRADSPAKPHPNQIYASTILNFHIETARATVDSFRTRYPGTLGLAYVVASFAANFAIEKSAVSFGRISINRGPSMSGTHSYKCDYADESPQRGNTSRRALFPLLFPWPLRRRGRFAARPKTDQGVLVDGLRSRHVSEPVGG